VSRSDPRAHRRAAQLGVLLGALTTLVAAPAVAAATTAEQLDQEGTAALDAGDFATACPKFAESYRLEQGIGVLLRLALCYERAGLTASAWRRYQEAQGLAHRTGNAALGDLARRRMVALEPLLSTVTLRVHRVGGARVTLDGSPVTPDEWDRPLPVDAGVHEIVASAPGMQRFTRSLSSPDPDRTAIVDVELAPQPAPPAPAPEAPTLTDRPASGWQRPTALTLGAVGVAGLIVGGVTGGLALSAMSSARDQCPGHSHCSPQALALQERARHEATIADISFAAGGAAAIAGVVLWLLSPSAATTTDARFHVMPVVFSHGGGFASAAAF
jgi:hypothetical protein